MWLKSNGLVNNLIIICLTNNNLLNSINPWCSRKPLPAEGRRNCSLLEHRLPPLLEVWSFCNEQCEPSKLLWAKRVVQYVIELYPEVVIKLFDICVTNADTFYFILRTCEKKGMYWSLRHHIADMNRGGGDCSSTCAAGVLGRRFTFIFSASERWEKNKNTGTSLVRVPVKFRQKTGTGSNSV
jgi:hypothetical protein